jgi:hypothetical protein
MMRETRRSELSVESLSAESSERVGFAATGLVVRLLGMCECESQAINVLYRLYRAFNSYSRCLHIDTNTSTHHVACIQYDARRRLIPVRLPR